MILKTVVDQTFDRLGLIRDLAPDGLLSQRRAQELESARRPGVNFAQLDAF